MIDISKYIPCSSGLENNLFFGGTTCNMEQHATSKKCHHLKLGFVSHLGPSVSVWWMTHGETTNRNRKKQ